MKKGNPNNDNMKLVGLGNTRIFIDYALKSPWALH